MKLNKKTVVCLSVCVFAFTGCGGNGGKTEEEQFNEAKQQFENYTVDVTIQYAGGDKYDVLNSFLFVNQHGILRKLRMHF